MMFVPNLGHHISCGTFFQEFLQENRQIDAKYSHRFFAKKLGWQASFIADLIAGRRRLSLARALEFSAFCGLDTFDTERLIVMAMAESEQATVREYFSQQLRPLSEIRKEYVTDESEELLSDHELTAVFNLLQWAGKKLSAKEIMEKLYTFPDLSEQSVEKHLAKLIDTGAIAIEDGNLRILQESFVSDFKNANSDIMQFQSDAACNFQRWCEQVKRPFVSSSGVIQIPRDRFEEVKSKAFAFQNWLLETSKRARDSSQNSAKDNYLCQFGNQIFRLVDDDHG